MQQFKREPKTLFARCGMLLYGDDYVPDFAEHLGVAERTVQRWSSGRIEISDPDIWGRVLDLLWDNEQGIKAAAAEVMDLQVQMQNEANE